MLSATDLEICRNKLKEEKEHLQKAVKKAGANLISEPEDFKAEEDASACNSLNYVEIKLTSMQSGYLEKVKQALERLDKGTFGICLCCDFEIEEKRLLFRPSVELCTDCQQEKENTKKLRKSAAKDNSYDLPDDDKKVSETGEFDTVIEEVY
jgi:DnaK suppressor protein